jgi:hypothetical protein
MIQSYLKRHKYVWVNWKKHLQEIEPAGPYQFHHGYHMAQQVFDKLVDLVGDLIIVDETKGRALTNDNDHIAAELSVAAGLRYLGGEYFHMQSGSHQSTNNIEYFFNVIPFE